MKFSISQSELISSLNVVSKGAAARSTLPILGGVLVKAEDNSLTLEATDMDMSIRTTMPAMVEVEGQTVVPAKLFVDVVKSLPDAAVHIETNDDSATILCDASSFSLKTMLAEDFPGFPTVADATTINIPYDTFSTMVKKVAKVTSKDESRAILTGVLISAKEGNLRMVATDTYRLALTETEFNTDAEDFEAVIGGSFLTDLAGLPVSDDTIEIGLSENQIIVTYGPTTFINRRIEGNYPNYPQLLRDTYDMKATLRTKQFVDAVKRTSLLSNRSAPVKLDFNSASQTVYISTSSQDIGAASDTIGAKIEGDDVEIGFNFSYLLDGLNAIGSENVSIELVDGSKPGILRADGASSYLYLIMPMKINVG